MFFHVELISCSDNHLVWAVLFAGTRMAVPHMVFHLLVFVIRFLPEAFKDVRGLPNFKPSLLFMDHSNI